MEKENKFFAGRRTTEKENEKNIMRGKIFYLRRRKRTENEN